MLQTGFFMPMLPTPFLTFPFSAKSYSTFPLSNITFINFYYMDGLLYNGCNSFVALFSQTYLSKK
ncbi:hypothetical protein M23134_07548 [Microscilla marina ATCC 23134]|uniref:Uncharacterized protein n=1 Tax=Microscilla marina ATCC 23134 TaxID=313606 RepID=A1ZF38_MICM2|nr:hypothetical protein M23134_07548 [Microscilla marina ATCC 23134]